MTGLTRVTGLTRLTGVTGVTGVIGVIGIGEQNKQQQYKGRKIKDFNKWA